MKWFNNLKVGMKVLLSCLVFVIIIVVIAFQGITSMNSADTAFDKFYDDNFVPVRILNQIAKGILQVRVNMLQEQIAMQTNDVKEFEARIEESGKIHSENAERWKKLTPTFATDEEKKMADDFIKDYDETKRIAVSYVEALRKRDFTAADKFSDTWLKAYRPLKQAIDDFMTLQQKLGEEVLKEQGKTASNVMFISVLLLIGSIILGIIITMILSRSVSRPVAKGLEFAKTIADGDFTKRIDLNQKDELGQLGVALNKAADNLEGLISGSLTGMQSLSQAVEQISGGNQNLSQRTSEQASSLEEIASTIEQTTATIRQNAENAQNANKMSEKTSKMALDGATVVNNAVNSINEISQSSKKIGEIISLINEISFQTNLLSLNAAVEAARAGEQGRGFAVVAGEVRNLAQRSATAAKEIGTLINDSIDKIGNGTELVNKSGEALKEIIAAVTDVGKVISEIAAASQEQKQGIDQVNKAVTEMDTMTQQNAALVEETASASEEMANQAQDLMVMMEKFKVRNIGAAELSPKAHKSFHLHVNAAEAHSQRRDKSKERERDKIHEISTAGAGKQGLSETMKQEGFEEF